MFDIQELHTLFIFNIIHLKTKIKTNKRTCIRFHILVTCTSDTGSDSRRIQVEDNHTNPFLSYLFFHLAHKSDLLSFARFNKKLLLLFYIIKCTLNTQSEKMKTTLTVYFSTYLYTLDLCSSIKGTFIKSPIFSVY